MIGKTPSASVPSASTIHEPSETSSKKNGVEERELTESTDRKINRLHSLTPGTFILHSSDDGFPSRRTSDSKFRSTFRGVVHSSLDSYDVRIIGRDDSTGSECSHLVVVGRLAGEGVGSARNDGGGVRGSRSGGNVSGRGSDVGGRGSDVCGRGSDEGRGRRSGSESRSGSWGGGDTCGDSDDDGGSRGRSGSVGCGSSGVWKRRVSLRNMEDKGKEKLTRRGVGGGGDDSSLLGDESIERRLVGASPSSRF